LFKEETIEKCNLEDQLKSKIQQFSVLEQTKIQNLKDYENQSLEKFNRDLTQSKMIFEQQVETAKNKF